MRKVIGILAGIILANLVIFGSEQLLLQLPFGRAIEMDNAMQPGFMDNVPFTAQLWVVAGWLVGTFAGGLLAFRIARWDFAGWIVAGFVAAAGIANVTTIPHPFWMQFCALVLPFIGALFAFGIHRRMRAAGLNLKPR